MNKNIFATCLVLAAFAVAPSLASANPILTEPTGTPLAVGSPVAGTNVGRAFFTTSIGTFDCDSTAFHGTVAKNSTAGGVQIEITSFTIGGTGPLASGEPSNECTGVSFFTANASHRATGLPWCLQTPAASDVFSIRGGACGGSQTALTLDWTITGVPTCEYSRTSTANGILVTDGGGTNENNLVLSNQAWTLLSGSAVCWTETKFSVTFSLETDNEGHAAIYLSS